MTRQNVLCPLPFSTHSYQCRRHPCPIPIILYPSAYPPVYLYSLLLALHIIFLHLVSRMLFLFRDNGTVIKHQFNRVAVVLRLHTCLQSSFSIECCYRKTSLPLPQYYHIIFTVPTVSPWNSSRPSNSHHGYCGITAFPITVSSSNSV